MEIAVILAPLINTIIIIRQINIIFKNDEHKNFCNNVVPRGGGVLFFLSLAISGLGVIAFFDDKALVFIGLLYLVFGMGFLGFIDDFLGDSESKGFKGHIYCLLFKKEISTGLLKAFFGFILSLTAVSFLKEGFYVILLSALLIPLTTNAINSLDLRPGRAIKSFLVISLLLLIFGRNSDTPFLLAPFLATILVYLPYELKEQVMLGDSGANILGGGLGYIIILSFSIRIQIFVLLGLIIFQLFCEVYSISKIIDSNRFLTYLDSLGRTLREEGER